MLDNCGKLKFGLQEQFM